MWTATLDFMEAFDSITHKLIWNALKSCGIEHDYISLLKKLCRDQKAAQLTDEESDMFEIKKGTKQGRPSVKLALQHGSAKKRWKNTFHVGKRKMVWEST